MGQIYIVEKTFSKIDFKEKPLPKGEYENCRFLICDFSASELSDSKFIGCEFLECNLSLAKLAKTALRDVKFIGCKMLGLLFGDCSEFGLSFNFENCIVNHSSFYATKLKKTIFKNTQLQEVDFTDCDLTQAVFENCDLSRAIFNNTNIEKADFRTSHNYSINPEVNRIKKAKFSLSGISGLLDKYDITIEYSS